MPKTVLVVDDNAFVRHALCELFTSQADFDVCGEAENGQEGIQKAQEFHPDVIVMDFSMPVMNGIEAATALKRLMPAVPLIIGRPSFRSGQPKPSSQVRIKRLRSKRRSQTQKIDFSRDTCNILAPPSLDKDTV